MLKTVVTLLALALCGADLFVLRAQAEMKDTGCGWTCSEYTDCTYDSCRGTIELENPQYYDGYKSNYRFACNHYKRMPKDPEGVGRCDYRYIGKGAQDNPRITTCPISVANAGCIYKQDENTPAALEADAANVEPSTSDGASHHPCCVARWWMSLWLVVMLFWILICFC